MFSKLLPGRHHAPCPYCYAEIDLRAVAFRCSGRGQPGRSACQPVSDPRQEELFGNSRPTLPIVPASGRTSATCDSCGGETRMRLCPHCHSLLPHNFSADSPMFGLVGVRNSGKTVMLTVLDNELTGSVARRFQASIDTPGGTSGLAASLAQNQEQMQAKQALPAQTRASGGAKQAPAVYEWSYTRGRRNQRTIFSFYDNAGEDVSRQENAINQHYLAAASGIIVLLDPFSFPQNQEVARQRGAYDPQADSPESVLDAITYVLQTAHGVKQGKRITQPLAVVVSKIDAFMHQIPPGHPLRNPSSQQPMFETQEADDVHEHMCSLIWQWGGDALLRKLAQNYSKWRVFGASALGHEPDYSTSRVSSHGVQPHRVAEPLLWLMAERGFIPATKGS